MKKTNLFRFFAFCICPVLFSGCGGDKSVNDIVKKKLDAQINDTMSFETTHIVFQWDSKSSSLASGKFTATVYTTESFYKAVIRENALRQLGVSNDLTSELVLTQDQISNQIYELSRQHQHTSTGSVWSPPDTLQTQLNQSKSNLENLLKRIKTMELPTVFYDVEIEKRTAGTVEGTVSLSRNVDYTKNERNEWRINNFRIVSVSISRQNLTPESQLRYGVFKLNDPTTMETVGNTIRNRRQLIADAKRELKTAEDINKKKIDLFQKIDKELPPPTTTTTTTTTTIPPTSAKVDQLYGDLNVLNNKIASLDSDIKKRYEERNSMYRKIWDEPDPAKKAILESQLRSFDAATDKMENERRTTRDSRTPIYDALYDLILNDVKSLRTQKPQTTNEECINILSKHPAYTRAPDEDIKRDFVRRLERYLR